jgi:hypothetical protein
MQGAFKPPHTYEYVLVCNLVVIENWKVSRRFLAVRTCFETKSNVQMLLADFSTLKMEAIRSSETSVHTRSTRHHIPEDGILIFKQFKIVIIGTNVLLLLLLLLLLLFQASGLSNLNIAATFTPPIST